MKNPLRIISIMSTTKAHNLCVYNMMKKRDFFNHTEGRHVLFLGRGSSQKASKKGVYFPFCLKKGLFLPNGFKARKT